MHPRYFRDSSPVSELIEVLRYMEEREKSKKDEKKEPPKNPDAWGHWDYTVLIALIWSVTTPLGFCGYLYLVTELLKVMHHT